MKKCESIDKTNGSAAVCLNAVKHGILSRETVLPHESRQDFETLLHELQDEYLPNGQTERTLVEELATILWRKRRVLAAEGAQINSGIACAMANALRLVNTATPFLPRITCNELSDNESLPVREILALDTDGLERRRKALQVMYESVDKAHQLLTQGGRGAARRALAALPEAASALWFEKERYGETIFQVDRFLENEVLPHLAEEKRLLDNADLLRRQALGSAVSGLPFESIARYEAHLDRKFERTLSMLIKLKAMKTVPADGCQTLVGKGVVADCMRQVQ